MADEFEFDGEESASAVKSSNNGLVEVGQFKGNAVISLRRTPDDQHPFTFGLSKAKLILDNIDAVEDFVRKNAKK
jgi:hypothetical protein